MNDDLQHLETGVTAALNGLRTAEDRDRLHRAVFGREGLLEALLRPLRDMDPNERRARGTALNRFSHNLKAVFDEAARCNTRG